MVGIISNSAALFAQRNLSVSSSQSELSIARLSSGNKIIRASDDVSGLAIGTVLGTTVSTLRTILTGTSQARSLLSIADGGLKGISDILQRQKSLAVQSNTGTLSDNERAFLEQEFTNLTSEINRIVDNTNFNGIKLLNGSISGSAGVTTATGASTEDYSVDDIGDFSVVGTASGTIDAVAFAGNITTAHENLIGVIEFGAAFAGDGAVTVSIGGDTAVSVNPGGTDKQALLDDLVQGLNASAGANTSLFTYSALGGDKLIITSKGPEAGNAAAINAKTIAVVNGDSTVTVALNGAAAGAAGADLAATALNASQGNGSNAAVDEVTATAGSTVFNANLLGAISSLTGTYTAGADLGQSSFTASKVTFTAVVNGETYISDPVELSGAVANGSGTFTAFGNTLDDNTQLIFRKAGDGTTGATFRLTVNGDQTVGSQANATTVADTFLTDLTNAGISIVQERELSNFDGDELVGTILEGIADGAVTLFTDAFTSTGTFGDIGSFTYDRTTDKITTTINGVTYTSDLTDNTDGKTGTAYNTSSELLTLDGNLVFTSPDYATDGRKLVIALAGATSATTTIDSDAAETAFEAALNNAFGVGANESLTFQVGTTASDSIGLALDSAATSDLYVNDAGTAVSLSVATAADAIIASDVLDNAINTVTSLRAVIGALQSRFDFAAANITSSIQNTEAARSDFLDVDIADESTKFATSQVRLQASISVLAQANQIPQNLLKLIG